MSKNELEKMYDEAVIERGENYLHNVRSCIKIGSFLHAEVHGTHLYKTKVNLDTLEGECSCPYEYNCKHAVAAYLYYKKGRVANADKYINNLKNLSKEELIGIITKLIPEKPDLIKKFSFRKETNFEQWVDDFIDNFSQDEIENIKENLDCLNFEQLTRILEYVSKNEDSLNEVLADNYDSYDYYDDESDILYDFAYEIKEEIIKRIESKEQLISVLKKRLMNAEISDNAELFFKYKDIVKEYFTKEEYLIFLLESKSPDLAEIKENMETGKEHYLFLTVKQNIKLAERLGKYLNNDDLKFLVACETENAGEVIKYFNSFSALKKHYLVQPESVMDVLSKTKAIPEDIARSLFSKDYFNNYSEKSIRFLLKNLSDKEFIVANTMFDAKFTAIKEVVKRLGELRYNTGLVFKRKEFLKLRHWTEIVEILRFIRQSFGRDFLEDFIRFHEPQFLTSSTLKHNLKKEGIIIQNIRGELQVEIR